MERNAKINKKLCWNCEGNVSLQDQSCPYCGVSLEIYPIAGTASPMTSLTPPYKFGVKGDESIPAPPYASQEPSEDNITTSETNESTSSSDIWLWTASAILTLFAGATFTLFGLILALFSNEHGTLVLSWESSYWYLYLLIGLPICYFGWKTLSKIS